MGISDIRKTVAIGMAVLVTMLTLGLIPVNWTGRPGAERGADDAGRPAVTRSCGPTTRPHE